MNIQVRSASRYCGKTVLSILSAAAIYKVTSKEVVIVTNDLSDYALYFKECENYKENFLVNEQTICGEIDQATKLSNDLKCMCIQVSKGVYILPVHDKDAIEDLCTTMQRSSNVFIFDTNDVDLNPSYLRTIFLIFDNQEKKINELAEYYSRFTDIERYRTTLICNKFMIGYDNQDKILRILKTKRNQVIFMKYIFMLKNLPKNKLIDAVYKALDKDPDYVQYNAQLRELAQFGN